MIFTNKFDYDLLTDIDQVPTLHNPVGIFNIKWKKCFHYVEWDSSLYHPHFLGSCSVDLYHQQTRGWPWLATAVQAQAVLSWAVILVVMTSFCIFLTLSIFAKLSLSCLPNSGLLPCRELGEECGLLSGSCCGGEPNKSKNSLTIFSYYFR